MARFEIMIECGERFSTAADVEKAGFQVTGVFGRAGGKKARVVFEVDRENVFDATSSATLMQVADAVRKKLGDGYAWQQFASVRSLKEAAR